MSKIEHKRWMVFEARKIIGSSHLTLEAADAEARRLAAEQVGVQFVVLETQHFFEAEARVERSALYRDWSLEDLHALSSSNEQPATPATEPEKATATEEIQF